MTRYYVYIIKCEKWKNGVFQNYTYYTGMSSNPKRRLTEHRLGQRSNWMQRNNISPKELVYIEYVSDNYYLTLDREKQIKKLNLDRKLKLIQEYNQIK